MSLDRALVQAYLTNVQWALRNGDVPFSQSLLTHAIELLVPSQNTQPAASLHLEVGVGLDTGSRRSGSLNEDVVFATTGTCHPTHMQYGLFLVADGMGGHRNGHEASRLATETLVDFLLPRLQDGRLQGMDLGDAVVDAVL